MINTVIFDIGNVLVSFDWQTVLHDLGFEGKKFEIIADATYRSADWDERDRGVLTARETMARFISHAPQYADEIRLAVDNVDKTIHQYPYTKPWIRALKDRGLKVYYLSNYGKEGYDATAGELDFLPLMDGGILSYEVKMIKPNPWIYAELFQRYHIDPQTAVFFDDNPKNVAAARGVGLTAFEFTGYDAACAELKKLGIL